ncbi:10547_t:CDS:2 [Gigaspora rosea]|nr:10547_t:CDS:2 [Gigaspora rosea]
MSTEITNIFISMQSKWAAEANNWAKDRRVKITSGYLKEMAAGWYKRIKEEVEYWKVKENNETEKPKSFYHLFVEQFAPEERQHRWQMELYE